MFIYFLNILTILSILNIFSKLLLIQFYNDLPLSQMHPILDTVANHKSHEDDRVDHGH